MQRAQPEGPPKSQPAHLLLDVPQNHSALAREAARLAAQLRAVVADQVAGLGAAL
jgi:hypothetical protein